MFSLNIHKNKVLGMNFGLVLCLTILTASIISTSSSADISAGSRKADSLMISYYNGEIYSWAWMSGNKTINQHGVYGVYGIKGVPDRANYPGGRYGSVSWTDTDGNLWLFGGWGCAESGFVFHLNDLWRFNITSKEWAWISGNNTINQNGVYGTMGVSDMENYPGGRSGSVSWTDTDGNFWLFGGWGFDELVAFPGSLNDLWRFNITSKEWAWMSGNKTAGEFGVYGTNGVPDRANYPGARRWSVSWMDTDRNLWLFGGYGYDESTGSGQLNDLWRFNITSKEWAWMSGNKTIDEYGVYGTKGVPDVVNYPGGRSGSVSWTDTDGNLWLFGGEGYAESGNVGLLNDLWRFNITSKEWAWMLGNKTIDEYGVYGTKGVPDIANYLGGRSGSVSWTDTDGNFWLFGGWGYAESSSGRLNDLWRFNITSKEWAWMSGNKTTDENGVYDTKGVPDIANYPGCRHQSVSWTDTDGNFWLFGGEGYAESGNVGLLNDLWRFTITSKEWAWMSGNNTLEIDGVYGTKGVPDMANYPGSRRDSVTWTDTDGNLWLFGGSGRAASGGFGRLNDLWRFTITSKEWAWMSGNNTINQNGTYGTKGVPDMANYPGARYGSVSWTDTDGNLWLFGGTSGGSDQLNDLWRFTITSKEWAWMSGNKTAGEFGVYGTKGVANRTNYPGARENSVSWTDTDGNLWLFGGTGYAKSGGFGRLNDLWRFNITSKEWAWMSGNKTADEYGVYGTMGVANRTTYPGARSVLVSWTDTDGNLWLFGGQGHAESGIGDMNDLWRFNITSKEWTWMSGNKTVDEHGVYGTKGVANRTNYPGARENSVSWTDTDGNFWLFGGIGYNESGISGDMNDLWRFNITSKEWTWMSGNKSIDEHGVYGTKGVANRTNYPGARDASVSWTDTDGNLWLFGGWGYAESGISGDMNDLWSFKLGRAEESQPVGPIPSTGDDDDDDEEKDNFLLIVGVVSAISIIGVIAAISVILINKRLKLKRQT